MTTHPSHDHEQPELVFSPDVSVWQAEPGVLIVVNAAESFARLTLPVDDAERMLAGRFGEFISPQAAEALSALRAEGYVVSAQVPAQSQIRIISATPEASTGPLRSALERLLCSEGPIPVWPGAPEEIVVLAAVRPNPADVEACGRELSCVPLPVSAEGSSIVVGPWPQPFSTLPEAPAGLPSSFDLRDRRLAAHPAPEMLSTLWFPPDGARLAHPAEDTCLLAAAWLRTALHSTPDLLRHTETVVSAAGELSHHRVLPVPRADGAHPARPEQLILTVPESTQR